MFHEAIGKASKEVKGFLYNNRGVTQFYQFIEKSTELTERDNKRDSAAKPEG